MQGAVIHFAGFTLDTAECRLRRGEEVVELARRPFDALALMARHPGALIPKDRFIEEVWGGVSVGDEALTQAIKQIRQALGDDAANPRIIETERGRGYRFIAEVEGVATPVEAGARAKRIDLMLAGTLGGGAAGLVGGLIYGLAAGIGNEAWLPIVLVMTTLSLAVALLGAFALTGGMAIAAKLFQRDWLFSVAGAGLAGFVVGDLFHLALSGSMSVLLGTEHRDFTGGLEGLILGGAIAGGAQLAGGVNGVARRVVIGAALAGAAAGVLIKLAGGHLMASSLGALARRFHGADLDLGAFGALAEGGGLAVAVGGFEGAIYGAGVVGAIMLRIARNRADIMQ